MGRATRSLLGDHGSVTGPAFRSHSPNKISVQGKKIVQTVFFLQRTNNKATTSYGGKDKDFETPCQNIQKSLIYAEMHR